jgi:hypothetical protein
MPISYKLICIYPPKGETIFPEDNCTKSYDAFWASDYLCDRKSKTVFNDGT